MTGTGSAADPPPGTRLFRREPGTWGVPPEAVRQAAFVLGRVQADFGMGLGVRHIRWFHDAVPCARDGDADTFRAAAGELGHVVVAEPDVVWLRREHCGRALGVLTRTLVHELAHADQVVRGSRLTVEEAEAEADDLARIVCAGVAG